MKDDFFYEIFLSTLLLRIIRLRVLLALGEETKLCPGLAVSHPKKMDLAVENICEMAATRTCNALALRILKKENVFNGNLRA